MRLKGWGGEVANQLVLTEDEYLAIYGPDPIGEAGLHKTSSRLSKKQWGRLVKRSTEVDYKKQLRRQELRSEYQAKVDNGDIRPPSRLEKLKKIAAGHPDNESVQAARRLLEKEYGIV